MSSGWQDRFEKSASVTCVVDTDANITYCNPAWDRFALQNNGRGALASQVLGISLFVYVPDILKPHYRRLIDTSRREPTGAGSEYECNRAGQYCIYQLAVIAIPGTDLLAMVHSLRVARPMKLYPWKVSANHHGPGNVVTMCAQCRRTRNNHYNLWNWVPDFLKTPPRRLSYGICPECTMYLHA